MSTVHCSRLSLDVDASLRRHRRRAPPPAPRSAHVHQFGVLYLLFTPVGTGGLLVNATYFSVPATDSQSLNPLIPV